MAVRRLHPEQPESFAFSEENLAWAKTVIARYPDGRQASAVIPLLWRAQEQHEGWLPKPAIEYIAEMLDMPDIRVLEVATFYTMFQLSPVGKTAHIQVCGTTPCMLRGSDDILKVCKNRIAEKAHQLSEDGKFSWEEVECLGACVNAPMIQIFSDTYEDLTEETFNALLDRLEKGEAITPGPQIDRVYSTPEGGPTSLTDPALYDGSMIKGDRAIAAKAPETAEAAKPVEVPRKAEPAKAETKPEKPAEKPKAPDRTDTVPAPKLAAAKNIASDTSKDAAAAESEPALLTEPREGKKDNLKQIRGIGPKIEGLLNELGIYHFDQIAAWTGENKTWVDARLKFKGRIDRENWIGQARTLAGGEETAFSKRVEAGDVPTSKK